MGDGRCPRIRGQSHRVELIGVGGRCDQYIQAAQAPLEVLEAVNVVVPDRLLISDLPSWMRLFLWKPA